MFAEHSAEHDTMHEQDQIEPVGTWSYDGDIDQCIRQEVECTVSRLAADESSESSFQDDMLDDIDCPTMPTRESIDVSEPDIDMKLTCLEDEVIRLESEVTFLTKELTRRKAKSQEVSEEDIDSALQTIMERNNDQAKQDGSSDDAEDRVTQLESELQLNKESTGIEFTSATWEIIRRDENQLCRVQRHTGLSHGLTFSTVFMVLEEKSTSCAANEPPNKACITELDITVDQQAQGDLSAFINRAKKCCELMTFYRVFSKYALLHFVRKNTFIEIQSRNPSLVSFPKGPEGDVLSLTSLTGLCMDVSWCIRVVEFSNNVEQSLQLIAKETVPPSKLSMVSELSQKIERMARHHNPLFALNKILALPIFTNPQL